MTQPSFDIFETHDERRERENAEVRAAWSRPATCPTCGADEPDGYALWRNHEVSPTRRYEPTGPCRKQRRETQ